MVSGVVGSHKCYTATAESAGERILKIGQHLPKLLAREGCPFCVGVYKCPRSETKQFGRYFLVPSELRQEN